MNGSAFSTRDDADVEATRVDRFLWAVRVYKTRSQATDGCHGGHVRINGNPAKAASAVHVGDRVSARLHGCEKILEVVQIIDRRVSAPVAASCVIDHSPSSPDRELSVPVFARDASTGRPTKKDRRALDRIRGR
jgi:ribosome-associated heat shock protein Hsp15